MQPAATWKQDYWWPRASKPKIGKRRLSMGGRSNKRGKFQPWYPIHKTWRYR